MCQQDPPPRIAWYAANGKKVVKLAHKIFERTHIRLALCIEKTHAQRNFIIAQSSRDKCGALFLAWRQTLSTQLLEQITQHFRVDKGFIAAYHSKRNPPKVVRFYVRKKRVAVKSRLFSTTFPGAQW